MDGVRRSVAVLAARVRDAHAARVWLLLGHSSWDCRAELGIARAQGYRLLDVSRALAGIHDAVAGSGVSRRTLVAVAARTDSVADLITRRLATLARTGLRDLDASTVCAVVRQAVRDIRTAPPPPSAEEPADPALAALRHAVGDLTAGSYAIGELMLDTAPAYLSDADAAHVLASLCEEIGEGLASGLAARRYAMTGDRRALRGTVL